PSASPNGTARGPESSPADGSEPRVAHEQVFESAGLFAPRVRPDPAVLNGSPLPGRWGRGAVPGHGSAGQRVRPYEEGCPLAWAATLRAAAPYQAHRCRPGDGPIILRAADLRSWRRPRPAGCLLRSVVDASGSMAAWRRMRQTKAAVLSLLVQAYRRRDRVALLAFRGGGTELVLPPTWGLSAARRALEALPVGGTTPLAHG